MSAPPKVKGWCPSAHRPMMSGDGLVVRVRPFLASLTAAQALALCRLAERFGNGTLDLTSRANLQIRGVREDDHPHLLAELDDLGLIHADPRIEARRNILVSPDWSAGDLTHRLHGALIGALPDLPELPEKMGFALDTGGRACLRDGSADFRFEIGAGGGLILRADGAGRGRPVAEAEAMGALQELTAWFIATGGLASGRMGRHLARTPLPEAWLAEPPRPETEGYPIGDTHNGRILGAAFGRIGTTALTSLIQDSGATGLHLMLHRKVWLRGAASSDAHGFVTAPGDPIMDVHACPGAPYCPHSSVDTMALARRLAASGAGQLHVSGCAKGCALPRKAKTTLVGRDGAFDLVRDGAPWDEPHHRGLRPEAVRDLSELI